MVPSRSDLKRTPTSIALVSFSSTIDGVTLVPNRLHGQPMPTETPGDGDSTLPLSSVARVRILVVGAPCAIHVELQAVVPVAGCHVVPPSVETSTPATVPPPASV